MKKLVLTIAGVLLLCTPAIADPELRFTWTGIVVHHTATAGGTVEDFWNYHVKVKKWADVAYHYIIYRNGDIVKGRDLGQQGMHGDDRNWTHIGVALVGNNNFTKAQEDTLERVCLSLANKYDIQSIVRHHEECPGTSLDVETLKQEVLKNECKIISDDKK